MKSVLFLETIEEAKQVKKLIDTRDKNIIYTDIYSLNPNIYAYLKQNNIPSHSSSEMIDENLVVWKGPTFGFACMHMYQVQHLEQETLVLVVQESSRHLNADLNQD